MPSIALPDTKLGWYALITAALIVWFHAKHARACRKPWSRTCHRTDYDSQVGPGRAYALVLAAGMILIPLALTQTYDAATLGTATLVLCVAAAFESFVTGCMTPRHHRSKMCRLRLGDLLSIASCIAFLSVLLALVTGRRRCEDMSATFFEPSTTLFSY